MPALGPIAPEERPVLVLVDVAQASDRSDRPTGPNSGRHGARRSAIVTAFPSTIASTRTRSSA